jgi:hypothetical protein
VAVNGFRTYDPFVGAYLQPDPMVDDTLTSYVYVNSNPVGGNDPTGLDVKIYGSESIFVTGSAPSCSIDGPCWSDGIWGPGNFGPPYDPNPPSPGGAGNPNGNGSGSDQQYANCVADCKERFDYQVFDCSVSFEDQENACPVAPLYQFVSQASSCLAVCTHF